MRNKIIKSSNSSNNLLGEVAILNLHNKRGLRDMIVHRDSHTPHSSKKAMVNSPTSHIDTLKHKPLQLTDLKISQLQEMPKDF